MEIYERVIHETDAFQVRITVSHFRGIEWLHIRKYYMDFEENWHPTKEGVGIPLDIPNTRALLLGVLEIVSQAESAELINDILGDYLNEK